MEDYHHFSLDVRVNNLQAIKFYENLSDLALVQKKEGHTYSNGEAGLVYLIGPLK